MVDTFVLSVKQIINKIRNIRVLKRLLYRAEDIRKANPAIGYGQSLYFAAVDFGIYSRELFGNKYDPYGAPENSYRFIRATLGSLAARAYLRTDEAYRLSIKHKNFKV